MITKFMLTFVNFDDDVSEYPDIEFDCLADLVKYVDKIYPNYSSYGMTAVKAYR